MFILHWISHQIHLTWQQLTVDITIPHIITGIVLYWIVHTAAKRGHKSARRAEQLFKNETQRLFYNHIHGRHQGKPVDCPDCATIVAVDEITI